MIVLKLSSLSNACLSVMASVLKAYSALSSIAKQDGQAATATANQIITKALPAFEELFATIASVCDEERAETASTMASCIGLKWFFVEMTVYGSVVVPAIDALSLKLKTTVPSFKKKKDALAPELDQV